MAELEENFALENWTFLAEGKIHIILTNKERTHVLRLEKLADSESVYDSSDDESKFIRSNMQPWFSVGSVTISQRTHSLSAAFTNGIATKVDAIRPVGRKTQQKDGLLLSSIGYIGRNYNFIHKVMPNITPNEVLKCMKPTLCFDLKVKCGLKSTSPFIPADRALIKHTTSKYTIMQLFKLGKTLEKKQLLQRSQPAWGTFRKVSAYDPRDLCSGCASRVRTALETLLTNPQNNLKVVSDGVHVHGWDKIAGDTNLAAVCDSFMHGERAESWEMGGFDTRWSDGRARSSVQSVVEMVSAVLCGEDALQRLERMQMLDLLDVEGAALVFARLESLVASRAAALQLTLQALTSPTDELVLKGIAECVAAYRESGAASSCVSSCPVVVEELLRLEVGETSSECDKDAARFAATAWASTLSAENCTLLLKLWMLALVAKDASIIVTLQPVAAPTDSSDTPISCEQSDGESGSPWLVRTRQTDSHAGIVMRGCQGEMRLCQSSSVRPVVCSAAYCVSLVDVGLKDLDKVWAKELEEGDIMQLCAMGLQHLTKSGSDSHQ